MASVQLGSAYVEVRATQDKLKGDLDRAHDSISGRIGGAAKAAAAAATVAFAAIGVAAVGAGVAAIKLAGNLEQAVANISTIKPEIDTSAVFKSLNDMSTRVPQSAQQLGDSLYNVFSSIDVSVSDGLALVEKFAKGAVGASTSAETFGTAAIGVMNAYKLTTADADHISDVFFNTIKNGVITGEELAGSLGPVTQSAKAAGVELDVLGAMIAGVTKEGGPAAENVNNLNNFFMKLSTKEAQLELNNMGVATKTASGAFIPVLDVLTALKPRLESMTESARANALQAIFPDAQARIGAQTIISQLDNVKGFLVENQTVTGATSAAYDKMAKTFNSQSQILANTFQAMLTTVGASVLPGITPLVTAFAQTLPGAFQKAQDRVAPFVKEAQTIYETARNIAGAHGLGMIPAALTAVELRIGEVFGSKAQGQFHAVQDAAAKLGEAFGGGVKFLIEHGDAVKGLTEAYIILVGVNAMGQAPAAIGAIGVALRAVNLPMLAATAAVTAWAVAYETNFGKVREQTDFLAQVITSFPATVAKAFADNLQDLNQWVVLAGHELLMLSVRWGPVALQAGKDIAAGFANGLLFGLPAATANAWNLGAQAIASLRAAIDAHSDSIEAMEIGEDFGHGFATGIEDTIADVADAATAIADSSLNALVSAVATGLGAVMPQVRDLVTQAQADITDALDAEDRKTKRDAEIEEIKHGRAIAKLQAKLGAAKVSERKKVQEDITQAETAHQQRLEDMERSHSDRLIEMEFDAGDKIAAARQKQAEQTGAALAEFSRSFDQLQRETTQKSTAIGTRIAQAMASASADATSAIKTTWDNATAAMEAAGESLAGSRVLRGIRDAFSQQQDDSALTHSKEREDAETTYKRALDLKEAEFQRDNDLGKARRVFDQKMREADSAEERHKLQDEYDAERNGIRQRFTDFQADQAHRQALEDEATTRRRGLEDEERKWRAGQEQARRDFDDGLEATALQKNVKRMAEERDERIKAIKAALTEKQAQIVQQEKDERAALNTSYEEKVTDLRAILTSKLPAVMGEAQGALTTFLDAIAAKVATTTGDILTNTAKATAAMAGVASGAAGGERLFSPGDTLPSGYQTLVSDNVVNDQGEVRVHRRDAQGNWRFDVHKERVDGGASYGQDWRSDPTKNPNLLTGNPGLTDADIFKRIASAGVPTMATLGIDRRFAGSYTQDFDTGSGASTYAMVTVEIDGIALARRLAPLLVPELAHSGGTSVPF